MPNGVNYTVDQLLQESPTPSTSTNDTNHRNNSIFRRNIFSISSSSSHTPAEIINKKRRTISLSSDDDIVELQPEHNCQRITKKRLTKQTNNISPHKLDE
jgi:hypothetical protein